MDNKEYITLKNVKVVFCDLTDKGYGQSITIDASDPQVKSLITSWVELNNVSKGSPKFKEYTHDDGTTTTQYTFKIGKFTKFQDGSKVTDNPSEVTLGYGDTINLLAKAYEYEHPKFGKGISQVLNAVFIKEHKHKSALEQLAEE